MSFTVFPSLMRACVIAHACLHYYLCTHVLLLLLLLLLLMGKSAGTYI